MIAPPASRKGTCRACLLLYTNPKTEGIKLNVRSASMAILDRRGTLRSESDNVFLQK